MTQHLLYPKFQAIDASGNPLIGGLVYTYESGTTTDKKTYSDAAMSTENANPVVLDSRGEAMIYGSGTYTIKVTDSAGGLVWSEDNVRGAGSFVHGLPCLGDYDNLGAALDDIGATETILVIDDAQTLTDDETVPSTLSLWFLRDCPLTLSTYDLVINGEIINPSRQQYFNCNDTGRVTFSAKTALYYYWEWFGDGTADGTKTDISTELQLLADALPYATAKDDTEETAGVVLIGEGRYIVNGVDFYQGVSIRGSGRYSTMFFWDDEYYGIRIKPYTSTPNQPATNISQINFRGGGDVADGDSRLGNIFSGTYDADGLYATQIHIFDCWFASNYVGIYLYGSTNSSIHDNTWDGNVTAIHLKNSTENRIYNNEFFSLNRAAINVEETNVPGTERVNHIYNNNFVAMEAGAIRQYKTGITDIDGRLHVVDNTFTMVATGSLYTTYAMISTDYLEKSYINGNIFQNENTTKTINGILVNHPGSVVKIERNRMEGCQYGITINNGQDSVINDYTIKDNSVYNTNYCGIRVLDGASSTIVDGNTVINCNLAEETDDDKSGGIYVDADFITIRNNTVGDQKTTPLMERCVMVADAHYGIVIERNNKFFGWSTGLVPWGIIGSPDYRIDQKTFAGATSSSVIGTFMPGDVIWDSNCLGAGNQMGWLCSTAGSVGSLGGATGTIENGSSTLTLSAADAGIYPGQYIKVTPLAGDAYEGVVIWVDGTTVRVNNASGVATINAGTISLTPPTWIDMADAQ